MTRKIANDWGSRLGLAALAVAVLAAPGRAGADASAPSKEQCFDAHERAQAARKDSKLKAAAADYRICEHAACPKLVKKECEEAVKALAGQIPTVKLSVTSAGGASTAGVRVAVDGAAPIELPSGALELDPGDHVFRFEAPDGRHAEQRVTLAAGQIDVPVSAELPGPAKAVPPAPPPPAPEPAKAKTNPLVYVFGGVALIGLGGFVGFGLAGKSKQSDLDACKPSCEQSEVDDMRGKYLLADISLGVALVAGGLGAYFYVSGKKQGTEQATWVQAAPLRAGGAVRVGTTF